MIIEKFKKLSVTHLLKFTILIRIMVVLLRIISSHYKPLAAQTLAHINYLAHLATIVADITLAIKVVQLFHERFTKQFEHHKILEITIESLLLKIFFFLFFLNQKTTSEFVYFINNLLLTTKEHHTLLLIFLIFLLYVLYIYKLFALQSISINTQYIHMRLHKLFIKLSFKFLIASSLMIGFLHPLTNYFEIFHINDFVQQIATKATNTAHYYFHSYLFIIMQCTTILLALWISKDMRTIYTWYKQKNFRIRKPYKHD